MAVNSTAEDLKHSLEKHDAAFTALLSLIPAQYYIAPDPEVADSKWMKNKKRKTGEEIKENKKKAKQIKQAKFDPANNVSTTEALAQISSKNSTSLKEEAADTASSAINPLPPSASISELRAKLQARLQTFRRKRNADDPDDDAFVTSRDALEEERRKKRGEMRDRRRNERKEERRREKEAKAEKKTKANAGSEDVKAKTAKTQLIVPQITNNEDSLSFPAISLPSKFGDKSATALKKIANPSQALDHLDRHKSKLASMPEDKRKEIEEKEKWAKAEERAKGGKVADSEKILKNAVKRKEKTKAKSAKEWSERKRELEKSQAIAIKKRTDNIAKRAQDRRDKKSGVSNKGKGPKKGRPGFEGKKKGKK
ncbi:uncharacterized protein L203_104748 [Cryptococcus depauperatus CBS 7841]|uniref:Uncharacterized protein n=1 Tax=Cryptococcus depauperatus CBS 7841 TaxID=1295531 RepID=A0A1E3INL5_9TREE|nr:hypothetical protein L203_02051 [Cryptococcus depauperatus CBS 7841]